MCYFIYPDPDHKCWIIENYRTKNIVIIYNSSVIYNSSELVMLSSQNSAQHSETSVVIYLNNTRQIQVFF